MLRGYYRRGGERFLAIGAGIAAATLACELRDGRARRAAAGEVAGLLRGHARRSAEAGGELPAHEVNYEQSMVAPLLEILCAARELVAATSGSTTRSRRGCRGCSPSAAPSPTCGCATSPIRHWDGYWFGREQLWGDTFPHHWSALTANVLLMLPAAEAGAGARARRVRRRRSRSGSTPRT